VLLPAATAAVAADTPATQAAPAALPATDAPALDALAPFPLDALTLIAAAVPDWPSCPLQIVVSLPVARLPVWCVAPALRANPCVAFWTLSRTSPSGAEIRTAP
jgi:hypothetical protein